MTSEMQKVQKDATLAPSTVEAIGRTGEVPTVTDRRPRAPRAPETPLDYHHRVPEELWPDVKQILNASGETWHRICPTSQSEKSTYTTWEVIDETTVMVR